MTKIIGLFWAKRDRASGRRYILAIDVRVYLWGGGGFLFLFVKGFVVKLRANRALRIDGKQVGLFVARMRLWRGQNSQASLEDYLLYLEQRGFNRWSKKRSTNWWTGSGMRKLKSPSPKIRSVILDLDASSRHHGKSGEAQGNGVASAGTPCDASGRCVGR